MWDVVMVPRASPEGERVHMVSPWGGVKQP